MNSKNKSTNEIVSQKAWLELCWEFEKDKPVTNAMQLEERHEERMNGDYDWTGVVVFRLSPDNPARKRLTDAGIPLFVSDKRAIAGESLNLNGQCQGPKLKN